MPEVRILKQDSSLHIAFWQITETEEKLHLGLALSAAAKARLSSRKSTTHRKGYLAIRQLLKQMKIVPKTHQYDHLGAPYMTDGRFLSFSHTKSYAAVALSNIPVGIDIEKYQPKILRIAPRFLNSAELKGEQHIDDIESVTQIWTAKEAIYKVLRVPGTHFLKQMKIHPFKVGDLKGSATVFLEEGIKEFDLQFLYFKNYCATIATFKNNLF